jgi:hypothetical protein
MEYKEIKFWQKNYILLDDTVMCYGFNGTETYLVYSVFYPPIDEKYRIHFTLNYKLSLNKENPKETIDKFFRLLLLQ